MPIEKPTDVTSFETDAQVANLNENLNALFEKASTIKPTDIIPTVETVAVGELVIYDDGAGTKRLYVVTAKKNLGYVNLT